MHSIEIVLVIVTTNTWCGAQAGLAGVGGDYGEYLNLLKGNDGLDEFGGGSLDDIEAEQARQEAVIGGEEEELKDGFLRHLKSANKKKKDAHFHFDVNVLVVNKNMTPAGKPTNEMFNPNLEKEIKFMERESNGGPLPGASKSEPFDWKKFQVRYCILYKFNSSNQNKSGQTSRTNRWRGFWGLGRTDWRASWFFPWRSAWQWKSSRINSWRTRWFIPWWSA